MVDKLRCVRLGVLHPIE